MSGSVERSAESPLHAGPFGSIGVGPHALLSIFFMQHQWPPIDKAVPTVALINILPLPIAQF